MPTENEQFLMTKIEELQFELQQLAVDVSAITEKHQSAISVRLQLYTKQMFGRFGSFQVPFYPTETNCTVTVTANVFGTMETIPFSFGFSGDCINVMLKSQYSSAIIQVSHMPEPEYCYHDPIRMIHYTSNEFPSEPVRPTTMDFNLTEVHVVKEPVCKEAYIEDGNGVSNTFAEHFDKITKMDEEL